MDRQQQSDILGFNGTMLRLTADEMLAEWKLRHGFTIGRRECAVERDDGIDLDAGLRCDIDVWYESLLANAPAEWLPVYDIAGECRLEVNSDLSARLLLPASCRRVLEVKLSEWLRAVRVFEAPDSPRARLQQYPWTRGGIECPVCVSAHRSLLLYSAASASATAERVLAICAPEDGSYVFSPIAWASLSENSNGKIG